MAFAPQRLSDGTELKSDDKSGREWARRVPMVTEPDILGDSDLSQLHNNHDELRLLT
jgi:hypothetical protein